LRLPATFQPTSSLHCRSTFQPRFPIDLRLSSAISVPALPSNSTSDSHRMSDPSVSLQIHFQLAPSTNLPTQPSSQLSTRVSNQPSGSAFVSTCDLRRLPILRPTFRLISSLRLQSIFSQTFPSTFDLRLRSTFQFRLRIDLRLAPPADPPACLPTDFQLAPSIRLPASPTNLTSDSHRLLHSLAASESPCDLRR